MNRHSVLLSCIIFLSFLAATCQSQPHYVAIDLGFQAEANQWTNPGNAGVHINNSGQIAYTYSPLSTNGNYVGPQAELYSDGSSIDITATGSSPYGELAKDLNNLGHVVGYLNIDSQAFFYSDGVLNENLSENFPGDLGCFALGINDSDVIVGYCFLPTRNYGQPFVLADGSFVVLTNEITETWGGGAAYDINNAGQVITQWDESGRGGPYRSFLCSGGSMTDLGTLPGGSSCQAYCLNNSGAILGTSDVGDGGSDHVFLYVNSAMQDLTSAAGLASAADMNNLGEIVGTDTNDSPVLYMQGTTYNLKSILVHSNYASGIFAVGAINDSGQIVAGSATTTYLLNPVQIQPLTFIQGTAGFQNNQFSCQLSSTPGLILAIDGSTNLLQWTTLAYVTNLTGTNVFIDPDTNAPLQFYRLRQL